MGNGHSLRLRLRRALSAGVAVVEFNRSLNLAEFNRSFDVIHSPMKIPVTVGLVILLLVAPWLMAAPPPTGQVLLATAQRQADLFSRDASPFWLEVDFVAQVRTPLQGHLTWKWEAKDRWWRKITLGDFQEIDIKNGEKLYTSRNVQFTPLRVGQLLSLISVAHHAADSQIRKQKTRAGHGTTLSCLEIREQDKPHQDSELCLNVDSLEISGEEWKEFGDQSYRREYSDYLDFRGHRYPRKLELFENGSKALTANVVSLVTAPLEDAILIAPKGAIERRQCADLKHAVALKEPDPAYPRSAVENRITGSTAVAMTVLVDGSVNNIQLVGSAGHSLDDATLQTLKTWKFKPAMCGNDPVESDVTVMVNFALR